MMKTMRGYYKYFLVIKLILYAGVDFPYVECIKNVLFYSRYAKFNGFQSKYTNFEFISLHEERDKNWFIKLIDRKA